MKDETAASIVNGVVLLALAATSIYQIYVYKLYMNTFEIVFTTLIELVVFILVILGFWIIIRDVKTSNNVAIVGQPTDTNIEMWKIYKL